MVYRHHHSVCPVPTVLTLDSSYLKRQNDNAQKQITELNSNHPFRWSSKRYCNILATVTTLSRTLTGVFFHYLGSLLLCLGPYDALN